ncbi:MAG TPA: hypothetical protein VN719_16750 [Gemmatimonadales bacterium]|nr:hypothetical protein [Gemmatimonadales bacterium]
MSGESAGLIDLDAVLAPDIRVKLGGETYRLPGDAPTETLLSIVQLTEEMDKAVKATDETRILELRAEMAERVEDLFALRQDIPEGFGAAIPEVQTVELVRRLFQHYYGDGEGGDRPTTPTPASSRNGARSRPRSGRTAKPRSPSSASSTS